MNTTNLDNRIINKLDQDYYLPIAIESFLLDRKVRNLSPRTIDFYQEKLNLFLKFADGQAITRVDQIDSNLVRRYLFWLSEQNHNPGGIAAHYTSLKIFVRFWIAEIEPDNFKNPFSKVKSPKVDIPPLEPVNTEDVNELLNTCENNFTGKRDYALLLVLIDTGIRASECLSIDLDDLDLANGSILIRVSKNRKFRNVFIGKRARKAIRDYLKLRDDNHPALWITSDRGNRLAYSGLKSIMRRRADKAGITCPPIHAFRRSFALSMLRAGVDVYSLQLLMGHADLQILRRYLKQNDEDLQIAHSKCSPGDKL